MTTVYKKIVADLSRDGLLLKDLKHVQTFDFCMIAVKQNPRALEFAKIQNEKICLEAVSNDASTLQFVHEQTEKICRTALKNNTLAIQYIEPKFQTNDICLDVIREFSFLIKSIKNPTYEMYMIAFEKGIDVKLSREKSLELVKHNGLILKYIEDQDDEICIAAIRQNINALQYVKNQTIKICTYAFYEDRDAYILINNPVKKFIFEQLRALR